MFKNAASVVENVSALEDGVKGAAMEHDE